MTTVFNRSYPTLLFQIRSHLRSSAQGRDKKREKTRWKKTREKRSGANRRSPSRSMHQFIDAVGDALHGFAQLLDASVCDVVFGDVAGPYVVHQPLRERSRQNEFAFRHPAEPWVFHRERNGDRRVERFGFPCIDFDFRRIGALAEGSSASTRKRSLGAVALGTKPARLSQGSRASRMASMHTRQALSALIEERLSSRMQRHMVLISVRLTTSGARRRASRYRARRTASRRLR